MKVNRMLSKKYLFEKNNKRQSTGTNTSNYLTISSGRSKKNSDNGFDNYLYLDAYPQYDNRGFNKICREYMYNIPVKNNYIIVIEADWNLKRNGEKCDFVSVIKRVVDEIKFMENLKYFFDEDDKYYKIFIFIEKNIQNVLDEIFKYTNCDDMKFSLNIYDKSIVPVESLQDVLSFINYEKFDMAYYFEQSHDMFSIIYDGNIFQNDEIVNNFERVCLDRKWLINYI